jgi:hypothetical protein
MQFNELIKNGNMVFISLSLLQFDLFCLDAFHNIHFDKNPAPVHIEV